MKLLDLSNLQEHKVSPVEKALAKTRQRLEELAKEKSKTPKQGKENFVASCEDQQKSDF